MRNVRQLLVFLVWDEFHYAKVSRLPFVLPLCHLSRVSCLFNPPCAEKHCHFTPIYSFSSFCVFIWGDITGVTYLGHSLHVVYWPGTMFIILVSDMTF